MTQLHCPLLQLVRVSQLSVCSKTSPSSSSVSFGKQTDSQTVSHDDSLKSMMWMFVRASMKNHSFSSNPDLQLYLSKAFPDNPAVSALQLGETNTMYMTVFGLAYPY